VQLLCTCADHKSAKKTDSLNVFFALLGSAQKSFAKNVGKIDTCKGITYFLFVVLFIFVTILLPN